MKLVNIWKRINIKFNFLSCFIFLYFCIFYPTTIFLAIFANKIPTRIFSLPLLILVLITLVLALPTILKKINYRDLVFAGLFILAMIMVFVRQNISKAYISGVKTIFSSCLFFFIAFRFSDYKKSYRYIIIGSYILSIALFIYSFISKRSGRVEDMTNSYLSSIVSAIIVSYSILICKNRFYSFIGLCFAGLALTASVFFGSRGPIIFFCIFAIGLLYYKLFWKNKNRLTIALVIIISLCLIVIFFIFLIKILYKNNVIGFGNPLYQLYYNMLYSAGRSSLFKLAIKGTHYSLSYGNGLFGDRNLTTAFYFTDHFTYSHNIFIEVVASFGWFGFIIIASFLATYFVNCSSTVRLDVKKASLALPLLLVGVLSLLISGSFITSNYFWGFCGICLSILSDKKPLVS